MEGRQLFLKAGIFSIENYAKNRNIIKLGFVYEVKARFRQAIATGSLTMLRMRNSVATGGTGAHFLFDLVEVRSG